MRLRAGIGFLLAWCLATAAAAGLRVERLRCEDATSPRTIGTSQPRLGWMVTGDGHDRRQTAYQIQVASSPRQLERGQPDLWDSGRVSSGQTAYVPYAGRTLGSHQVCCWRVRVWDEAGRVSAWSPAGRWETGLLAPTPWQAAWIGRGPPTEPRPPAGFFTSTNQLTNFTAKVAYDAGSTLLRREFTIDRPLRRATAYVTGLGYYELFCNGRRVGDQVLAPAVSNYRAWIDYDAHDLTRQLRPGPNALGLHLGNGWFNPLPKWWDVYRMPWFGAPRARLQLHLEYQDGTTALIGTDETWKSAPGPVRSSCVYDGETYDATLESPGWDRPGFDDRDWTAAHRVDPPGGELVVPTMPPIRVTQSLPARSCREVRPGVFVFDVGQNASGWARLKVRGPRGTKVTLRYAEDVAADGSLDVTSNEKALATDVYVLRGRGWETYEPRFTFHGFRYVEVTGLPEPPRLDQLEGRVVHTDVESTGQFTCANPLIERLHRATRWSQRSNLMGYPMDCPQRDERLGWFGDAMVTADEALLNFDTLGFFRHWLDGIRRNQNPTNGDISIISPRPYVPDEPDPTWSSAYPVVVWQCYLVSGDRQFLATHFEAMRRYVDYLGTQAREDVLPKYWIGDWGSTEAGWKEGDPASVGTGFYHLDATIVARAAAVLGRADEARRYAALAARIGAAFHARFFDATRGQYDAGGQFSQAFPLVLGLVPESRHADVLRRILDDLKAHHGHFTVGVLGAKYLIDALTQAGRADVAYDLVNVPGQPGWAHLIEGQTTLCEFWDRHGSHNHVMLGSIDAWFYRTLAGIQLDENRPGYEHVLIRPWLPPSLPAVQAAIETVRGRVASAWQQSASGYELRVEIPVNTTATVRLPTQANDLIQVRPKRPEQSRTADAAVFALGSGRYSFRVARPAP